MNEKVNNRLKDLIKALNFEKQNEIQDYKDSIKNQSIQDRLAIGKSLYPLEYIGVKYSKFGDVFYEFAVHENQNLDRFSSGSLIEIFNIDEMTEKGIVQYSAYSKISVSIKYNESDNHDLDDWIGKGKVGINLLPDSKTYDVYLNKLKSIEDTEAPFQIEYIYNEGRKVFDSMREVSLTHLNRSQNKAVSQILKKENPVTIIHGPPGTGKTTTIVAAIKELVEQNKKVVICAPTNAAVDNVCQYLVEEEIKTCRIGNPVKIDSELQSVTLDGQAQNDNSFKLVEQLKKQSVILRKKAFKYKRNFGKDEFIERKRMKQDLMSIKKDIKKIQKDIYSSILEKSSVICGTFIGVLNEDLSKIDFDYIFIDEAGQSIEPAIWSVSKLANNMVLAGDNFQLPPFVQSKDSIRLGLNQSILDSAFTYKFPSIILDIQYRMNQKIMSFSNQYFYDSKLTAYEGVNNWMIENDGFESIEFIDTAGCGYDELRDDQLKGVFNNGEVNLITKRCVELDLLENTYGIISPYRLQVKFIKDHLQDLIQNNINTIDSFQGQERDIIIISLVRSNERSEIGFLNDYRRMNVAMTRAKKKLIIIGDSSTIGRDKFYSKLLDYIEVNGSYRSAWEYFE
jgi:ATP-dependent RNA/DNA helicase IGHMBP2